MVLFKKIIQDIPENRGFLHSRAEKFAKVAQAPKTKVAKVTQDFSDRIKAKKSLKLHYSLQLSIVALVLCTPKILNTNIEQAKIIKSRGNFSNTSKALLVPKLMI